MALTPEMMELIKQEACRVAQAEFQRSAADLREQVSELRQQIAILIGHANMDLKSLAPQASSEELQGADLDGYCRIAKGKSSELVIDRGMPSKLATDYTVLLKDEEEPLVQAQRPESLFCYCVFELVAIAEMDGPSAVRRRCKLMLMLALLVFVEFLLATALYESSWFVLETEVWAPPGSNGPSTTCYYQSTPTLFGLPFRLFGKVLYGKPRVEWAVAAFSYFVVLLTIKGDDRQVLAMADPKPLSFLVGRALFLLWLLRSFYRSAWISAATIVLIAGSSDISSIILNSVAATFLLEIDDLAYNAVLSPNQQERYQQEPAGHIKPFCDPSKIEFFSWVFYAINLVIGLAMYLTLAFVQLSADPLKLQPSNFLGFTISMMFGRTLVFSYLHVSKEETSVGFLWFATFACMAVSVFALAVLVGLFPWVFLGFQSDSPIHVDLVRSCMNKTDVAACAC